MKIGFISFRIAGNDGVSLEAERWRQILTSMGHQVTFIAGELDQQGILIPELHFAHPQAATIHQQIVDQKLDISKLESNIFEFSNQIETQLHQTFKTHKFDHLVVANIFSLPMHFSLSTALDRAINTGNIPTLSRHHDFWWERKRYQQTNGREKFFLKFFPPHNPLITHTVINSITQKQLKNKTGLDSFVLSDSFNFSNQTLNQIDDFNQHWRSDFGIKQDETVFLQATRIVPRKQIEISIKFVEKLNIPSSVLVIAGQDGDEGYTYTKKLKNLASKSRARVIFIGDRIKTKRQKLNSRRYYTLWDCFINSDFVTYPSLIEGFGNQFIESVYFKKPTMVNRYPVFKSDIEPLGFQTVSISNSQITQKSLNQTKKLLNDQQLYQSWTRDNFKLGEKHFSYQTIIKKLQKLGL